MHLFHYTSEHHLPLILESGLLRTTESNVSMTKSHAGPDVVWLTARDDVTSGNGLEGSAIDKFAIRFTVKLDKRVVSKWHAWGKGRGMDPEWMSILASSGGSGSWRVVERPILRESWVEIRRMSTGEIVSHEPTE